MENLSKNYFLIKYLIKWKKKFVNFYFFIGKWILSWKNKKNKKYRFHHKKKKMRNKK